jgi:hypothetical protein
VNTRRWLVLGGVTAGLAAGAGLAGLPGPAGAGSAGGGVELTLAGRFAGTAAEISAYDPTSRRLFVTDAGGRKVDVVDLSDPESPAGAGSIDVTPYGGSPTSVAVRDGVVAVAVAADPKTDPGKVVFFDSAGTFLTSVEVGALPDMLTFTPDGLALLVANEGEPDDDYLIDPPGSVSVIDMSGGVAALSQTSVRTAGFERYDARADRLRSQGVRIFGPGASVSQDLEPEYIAVDARSRTAWVTLQENNAVAVIDVKHARVAQVKALGFKDHSLDGNGLDASDRDNPAPPPNGIENISPWPVLGMYLPDAIAAYTHKGRTFYVTANEGDARDWEGTPGFEEEQRVGALDLDDTAFPSEAELKLNAKLGRLTVTTTLGDSDGDGDFDRLYAFGGRSFSIWAENGRLVFDSGDAFEQITADELPALFNGQSGGAFDTRSDNKGPEPEGVAIGEVDGRTYAFVGLERIGGIMVFDVTDPAAPAFVRYVNPEPAVDQAPEGLLFVPAPASPSGTPLLVVTNEDSGTTAVYEVEAL